MKTQWRYRDWCISDNMIFPTASVHTVCEVGIVAGVVGLFIGSFLLNEILGCFFADCVDVADFVLELDTVALVSNLH